MHLTSTCSTSHARSLQVAALTPSRYLLNGTGTQAVVEIHGNLRSAQQQQQQYLP